MSYQSALIKFRATSEEEGLEYLRNYFEDTCGEGKNYDWLDEVLITSIEKQSEDEGKEFKTWEDVESHWKDYSTAGLLRAKKYVESNTERLLKAFFLTLEEAPKQINSDEYLISNAAQKILKAGVEEALPKNLDEMIGSITRALIQNPVVLASSLRDLEQAYEAADEVQYISSICENYDVCFFDFTSDPSRDKTKDSLPVFYYIVKRHY